ncbi:hypothetical protein [Arsukibacterium sp.]|uniref:hypothetical protein n=1 Tax=Arsukibacterium sp. TaxID=1977258 RepID=UPI001BD6CC5C|nr:hypothetical protein [Arsukibacterium sp.]
MTKPTAPPLLTATLRQQAEQRLSNSAGQLSTAFNAGADALGVLYRLSSNASTANDGLKLLHELQVHQVELDLQLEQLQSNERELQHEFACYRQFFTMNPAACLVLSQDGVITAANDAASRLFAHLINTEHGLADKPLCGSSFLSLLSATCRPLFTAALARVQRSKQRATLLVTTVPDKQKDNAVAGAGTLRLSLSMSPDHHAILIMLT